MLKTQKKTLNIKISKNWGNYSYTTVIKKLLLTIKAIIKYKCYLFENNYVIFLS
jgi:hypothetical protein